MLLNVHSYHSLRYGTLSPKELVKMLLSLGYDRAVLTDINNSSGTLEYIRLCMEDGFDGLAGIEFRDGDRVLYIGVARNLEGFRELNEALSEANIQGRSMPDIAPQ